MSDTYRALCAELTEKLQEHTCLYEGHESELIARARAALAQPEPVAPTDEELIEPIVWMIDEHVYDTDKGEIAESLRELIARYGTPAIQPVPVSERLPLHLAGELDDQGTCWNYHPINLHYCLCVPDPSIHTHWLPHWALPLPTPTNNTKEENLNG